MKYFISFLILASSSFLACNEDHHHDGDGNYEYHAHINSPTAGEKALDEVIQLTVKFESHTGKPVHHINVQIKEKSSGQLMFNKPEIAHIYATEGVYTFSEQVKLASAIGYASGKTYQIIAKVWGVKGGFEEVSEILEFSIK